MGEGVVLFRCGLAFSLFDLLHFFYVEIEYALNISALVFTSLSRFALSLLCMNSTVSMRLP